MTSGIKRHFTVRFCSPKDGRPVQELVREASGSDPYAVGAWPSWAQSFTIHERVEEIVEDGEPRTIQERQVGPTYHHQDCKAETAHEVTHNPNCHTFLLSKIRVRGWTMVLWNRWRDGIQAFNPGADVVLDRLNSDVGRDG